MSQALLILITGLMAGAAITVDGITHQPFIDGSKTGEPVWNAQFIGRIWPDGDEMAFAGFTLPELKPRTGP